MKTFLVVDDSSTVRKVARRMLEQLSFKVTEAEDGQKALEQCATGLPDAILLDWNMPVTNGPDFLRQLRDRYGRGDPKVIFCTSENDPAQIAAALNGGADEYIMKPFDAEILKEKLEEVGLI
ncbi:response regulator [Segnochrobactrum spirostomi]|uniref:Response regulator n=1 Tax=Segnochrobactrum spirostomi TaxID=2608987 RepID=A0A6A7Y4V4_9HYPH|nr:response regulator [Segnochrobactrum spirostomi]MQT12729.1 response regulator [Segnochrobactrum spirostomi]